VSTLTKVFIVLTSVVAIVLSCLTVASAARWSNLKETVDKYQQLYEAELVHRMNAQTTMYVALAMKDDELRKATQQVASQETKLRDLDDQLAATRLELARKTNDAAAFEAGRKKLEELLGVQTAELTGAQKQNQMLLSQNIDLQTRNQRLATRNLEVTGQLTIALDESRNLQEKLYAAEQMSKDLQQRMAGGARAAAAEKAPVGVTPVQPPVVGPISGEVREINGAYVSLNIGESSGVVQGMPFMVYRGQTYVGDVAVENVRPKEAGGKITLLRAGQQVQPGDRVVYGLEGRQ
jgi:hypothetical protein